MGSGLSVCTGPSSVSVSIIEIRGPAEHNLDKGGAKRPATKASSKSRLPHDAKSPRSPCLDSEDEDAESRDELSVASGPSTPRLVSSSSSNLGPPMDDYGNRSIGIPSDMRRKHRRARTACKSMRHTPHSSLMVLDDAIHEEDEDGDNDGTSKYNRPYKSQRPKSANLRKCRDQTSPSCASLPSQHVPGTDDTSGGETDVTSEEGEDEFDPDMLSIPDETSWHWMRFRPDSITPVAHFPSHRLYGASTPYGHGLRKDDLDDEWWTEEDSASLLSRSRCSSFSTRSSSRAWLEGRVSKMPSERSISSVLLTTAVELDSRPASFVRPRQDITQHILKARHEWDTGINKHLKRGLYEIEQELRAAILPMCAKEEVTCQDYSHIVTSLRPRFLRLVSDLKLSSGEVMTRLPEDCQFVTQLEEYLTQRILDINRNTLGHLELGSLVKQHFNGLGEVYDREAAQALRPVGPLTMPASRWQLLLDLTESADKASEDKDLEDSDGLSQAGSDKDDHHECHINRPPASTGLYPSRASCKSARPTSLACSSRAMSSVGRHVTDRATNTGNRVATVLEDDDVADPSSNSSSSSSQTAPSGVCGETGKARPDSGIVLSSGSSSGSEAAREGGDGDLLSHSEYISPCLGRSDRVLQVSAESHQTIKSLAEAITTGCSSEQLKAHALYRWLACQNVANYSKCTTAKSASPAGKLRQIAEGRLSYAAVYQEMAKAVGLKCEKIEGYAKGQDYQPGTPLAASPRHHKHSWNAVLLNGQYHFVDASFGAVPSKCFVEHFFMTPPNEMRLSHFPRDKRWLLMTHSLSLQDFEGSLKTWPTMFAFNIRPLNMRSVLRSYDGKLSITVLLRNVAVFPQLEYVGPGTPQDAETLAFSVDQEIRNKDNAETFHLNLPEEGTYFFTLMVHDLEGDEDVPAFQYRVEYQDELL